MLRYCGPSCWWPLWLFVLCSHQCTSTRDWSVPWHLQWCGKWAKVVCFGKVSCGDVLWILILCVDGSSVYCATWMGAHLRYTQCWVLLHLDTYFLVCICLLQISQIQICLGAFVGPGLDTRITKRRLRMASFPKKTIAGGGMSRRSLQCLAILTFQPLRASYFWTMW